MIILNTFVKTYFLELKSIRIIIFITGVGIDFALIATKYKNGGTLDFIISLPKSIYSCLIGIIIGFLLNLLSNSKKQLTDIIKTEKDKGEFRNKARRILKRLKKKLIFYFLTNFILMIFFWYYVSAVYHDTQISWLTGGLTSFGISLCVPFLICLLFSSIRVLAIKYQHKMLYSILAFLNYII